MPGAAFLQILQSVCTRPAFFEHRGAPVVTERCKMLALRLSVDGCLKGGDGTGRHKQRQDDNQAKASAR